MIGGFAAGRKQMAIEDGNTDIGPDALVFGRNRRRGGSIDVGSVAGHGNRAYGGTRQIPFGVGEFVGGSRAARSDASSGRLSMAWVTNDIRVGGRRRRQRFVGELIVGRLVRPHSAAQLGERSRYAILRAQQQEFRFAIH